MDTFSPDHAPSAGPSIRPSFGSMIPVAIRAAALLLCLLFCFGLNAGSAFSQQRDLSCRQTVGAKKAAEYVRQCLMLSPATHPPCNASNPCELIVSEIRRSCQLVGFKDPICRQYRPDR